MYGHHWLFAYLLVWAIVFIRYKAMREAYQWIKTISSHTFFILIKNRFCLGIGEHKEFKIMSEELQKAVSMFCNLQPNLCEIHHPNDLSRLLYVVYVARRNNEVIPIGEIKKQLEEKPIDELYGGTTDSFIKSCEEYIEQAKSFLNDAQRINILK